MTLDVTIGETQEPDWRQLRDLYPAAFPGEDLLPLLAQLLKLPSGFLSVVATDAGELAGHAGFTLCGIAGTDRVAGLVGPVAVSPRYQRQGIGKALIAAGLDALARQGATKAFVLGDPAYYGKSGFTAEAKVAPPYPLPRAWKGAWQSIALDGGASSDIEGTLSVPAPWRDPALWSD